MSEKYKWVRRRTVDIDEIGSCIHRWMDGWMDGWMDRWMDGWIDGWMDGWMDG